VEDAEPLQALPPEEVPTFQNSGARMVLPSERALHRRAMLAALLALLAAAAGIVVGMDYLAGDDGMYTHRQLIYAQAATAPSGSATLTGVILDADGNPLVNYTMTVLADSGQIRNKTDAEGNFRFEGLDPGVAILDIDSPDRSEMFRNRILLSPPAAFESNGFTHLNLQWPDDASFDRAEDETGSRWIDHSDTQRENSTEPYDQTAGAMYDMFGTAFFALGTLSIILTGMGLRSRSAGLIRLGALTGFFSMGHLYVSCGLGLLAMLLTMALPKEE
jgi:hypothetical protein